MVIYLLLGGLVLDWVTDASLRVGDAGEIPSHFAPAVNDDTCTADLSRAQWVGPATLVGLAAFLDRETRNGRTGVVIGPSNFDLACYLSRMGVGRLLDEMGVEHDFPAVKADSRLNATSLVEVSRFQSESDVSQLIEILTYRSLPEQLRDVMCTLLSEMGNNVPQHAQVEHGFIAAQVVQGGTVLRLSVADTGVGMLATLRPRATTDAGALRLAIEGASEFTEPGRGRGIPGVKSAIEAWGGQATLLSGEAMVRVTPARTAFWSYPDARYPGTVFGAELPLAPGVGTSPAKPRPVV